MKVLKISDHVPHGWGIGPITKPCMGPNYPTDVPLEEVDLLQKNVAFCAIMT
jgi:hypothetical protein